MSELRDHSQLCEHGSKYYHTLRHPEYPPWTGRFLACPGGRAVPEDEIVEMAHSIWYAEQMDAYRKDLL